MLVFNDIQTKVINLIISHHQLSKNQLAILAELSRPTVSKVVNQLLEQGLLVEVQHNKKTYCQLNAEFDHVITVEINASYIRIGLFDFSLNLKDNHIISTYSYADRSQFLDALCQEIACFMASKTTLSIEKTIVSVATAGIVDSLTGEVIKGTHNFPDWQQFNLAQAISNRLNRPVLVENNVRASLIGECYLMKANQNNSFALVCLDAGVGAALFCEGVILRGAYHGAGEIGFMMTAREDLSHVWKKRGALEQHCSLTGMNEKYEQLTGIKLQGDAFFEYLMQKEPNAQFVFRSFVDYLAMSLINIVAIADPEKIIFYGRTSQHHVSFFKPVQAMLAAHQIQVELAVSEQPETIASIGAAILGFKMKYPNLRYAHPV